MAKGNLLLGMGRGKLGDIVLSRAYGEQISRARAKVVKNPKTKGQQVQRIILSTVTKAYSQMKAIVNHSWQGVSYGAESMNKFNSLNMDFLRNQLTAFGLDNDSDNPNDWAFFITANNQLAVPNRWAIARGTLPTIPIVPFGDDEEAIKLFTAYDSGDAQQEDLTYSQLVNGLGIAEGDQLTICIIDSAGKFHYGRFIAAPNDGDMTGSVADPELFNERNLNISVDFINGKFSLGCASLDASNEHAMAAGLILSRKQGTTWQRSNTDMVIWNQDYSGIGNSMNDALWQAETGALDFSSPYYLNNANQNQNVGSEDDDENP